MGLPGAKDRVLPPRDGLSAAGVPQLGIVPAVRGVVYREAIPLSVRRAGMIETTRRRKRRTGEHLRGAGVSFAFGLFGAVEIPQNQSMPRPG